MLELYGHVSQPQVQPSQHKLSSTGVKMILLLTAHTRMTKRIEHFLIITYLMSHSCKRTYMSLALTFMDTLFQLQVHTSEYTIVGAVRSYICWLMHVLLSLSLSCSLCLSIALSLSLNHALHTHTYPPPYYSTTCHPHTLHSPAAAAAASGATEGSGLRN